MTDKPYNPWREFIENVISGDNFFRTQEYYDLLDDLDARIAKEAEHDARIAALTAEVDALRGLMRQIHVLAADPIRSFEETNDEIERIARAVLRESK